MPAQSKVQESVTLEGDEIAQATDDELNPAEDEGEELSLDVIFEALKNKRRRHVIHYLNEQRDRESLSDLAEHIAALENDTTPEMLTSQQRKRVYIALYQCHLPKLDTMGIIDFDSNRGHAELSSAADQLEKYLSIDEDDSRPWPYYYAALGIVSGLAFWLGAVTNATAIGGAAVLLGMICVGGLVSARHYASE